MSQTFKIKIKEGFKNGDLLISHEFLLVAKRDKVRWIARKANLVDAITEIKVKPGYSDIFEHPIVYSGKTCEAKIRQDAAGKEAKYSICWRDTDGVDQEYDPIIAVKPSNHPDDTSYSGMSKTMMGLAIGLVAVLALQFLIKNKTKL